MGGTIELPGFRDGIDRAAQTLFNDAAMNHMTDTNRDLLHVCQEPPWPDDQPSLTEIGVI